MTALNWFFGFHSKISVIQNIHVRKTHFNYYTNDVKKKKNLPAKSDVTALNWFFGGIDPLPQWFQTYISSTILSVVQTPYSGIPEM